jgi:hypothetical protein
MATRFSNSVSPANDTNAHFQGWAQFFEDTLVTTGGWVVTADTGQTLPSALAIPAGNVKAGYRIYRMADALQATSPVFMRIDFGASANSVVPGFWVTIGTGSNGSGTITGILFNGGVVGTPTVANSGNSVTALNSYGSASTGRATMAIGVGTNNATSLIFCIERTKDSLGADTGDGLLLLYNSVTSAINSSRYIIMAGGTQPALESPSYILTASNPSQTFAPGDIGVGVVIHMKGIAQQPGANMMIVNSADVAAEGSFSLTLYGATRTYQHCNAIPPYKALAGSGGIDTNARCCIRYD